MLVLPPFAMMELTLIKQRAIQALSETSDPVLFNAYLNLVQATHEVILAGVTDKTLGKIRDKIKSGQIDPFQALNELATDLGMTPEEIVKKAPDWVKDVLEDADDDKS